MSESSIPHLPPFADVSQQAAPVEVDHASTVRVPTSAVRESPAEQPAATGKLVSLGSDPIGGLQHDLNPNSVLEKSRDFSVMLNPKRVWDVSLVHILDHESVVCSVKFSADGKYLATGCNRTAQIFDTETGGKICVFPHGPADQTTDMFVRAVCFSPDGKFLATGAEDKLIKIWDVANNRLWNTFRGHGKEVYCLGFSPDGRLLVSGSGDDTLRIWNMSNFSPKLLSFNHLHGDPGVISVIISPNGQLLAAGCLDGVVRIWDIATGSLVDILLGHRDSVYSIAFMPDGKGLVSGSLDGTLMYWDVRELMPSPITGQGEGSPASGTCLLVGRKTGKPAQCKMTLIGHKDYVLTLAVSHDGQWIVSGSKDRYVRIWDSRSGVTQCVLSGHQNSIISLDLNPKSGVLATGSGDYETRIWSYHTAPSI